MMYLALLLALAAPAPPAAASPVAVPPITIESLDSGPIRSDAIGMVRATMPEAPYKAMLNAMVKRGIRDGFQDDAAALEEQSPGIMAEIDRAMVSLSEPFLERSYRTTLARYARLYTAKLTPQDTADMTAFYRSPTGQKLIAQKYGQMLEGDLPDGLVNPDKTATTSDIAALNRNVTKGMMAKLGPADEAEIMKMMNSPAFKKLSLLVPLINKLEADAANEADPEMEAALAKAMADIFDRRKITI